ncbi:hypothetical protein Poli38472_002243 [Pythium oligandrum]|uniref:Sodium/calcium exchanger membrane region domain-containing protein n=1 Tax=Pythium oligandrum TaxID=41045 RepID=A0A8K1FKY6_PYTOL|nr:hypothetical protein Poli38472_002243 [Pythium oligandrum]|eukprot:TMW63302.1 hypothetical protein Poli38472_002243 [Pythium oligandrum]
MRAINEEKRATRRLKRALSIAAVFVVCCWLLQWLPHPSEKSVADTTSVFRTQIVAETETAEVETPRCDRGANPNDTFLDYETLVQCTWLRDSVVTSRTILIVILVLLLYLLSSTADSFFCPVLQTIVEKYRIPPDIAGVTFLSFGNGSPDVFSNIAAFSTASPKIGVTSILGGGLLVTTVIAASVGFASQGQEQLIPRKYVRDVIFYMIAIVYLCFVFFGGVVHLPEALGFLCIFACYIATILLDSHIARLFYSAVGHDYEEVVAYGTNNHGSPPYAGTLSDSGGEKSTPYDSEGFMLPAYDVYRIPTYPTSDSEQSENSLTSIMPKLFRKTSAPTPRSEKRKDPHYRESSPSDSTPLLWQEDSSLRRPASVCVPTMQRQLKKARKRTAWEKTEMSAHFNLTAKRWTRGYHELSRIEEFPSVSEAGEQVELTEDEEETQSAENRADEHTDLTSAHTYEHLSPTRWFFQIFHTGFQVFEWIIWNPIEFVTTFVRRMTIPLVDEDTWHKGFAMVCPPCALLLFGVSVFELNPLENVLFALVVLVGGAVGSAFVYFTASSSSPPDGLWLLPYIALAFVMSVVWIMSIANEVLAVLQVLGSLFGISNSVLGVSVLAWGNSVGDLVSNTAIARDGFPTMAFAGCFAGPMFNLLVGIGLALTIAIATNGPISMGEPSPLVSVGFAFLFVSLVLNLGFAAYDGFQYRSRLCYLLLGLYVSFVVLSVVIIIVSDTE